MVGVGFIVKHLNVFTYIYTNIKSKLPHIRFQLGYLLFYLSITRTLHLNNKLVFVITGNENIRFHSVTVAYSERLLVDNLSFPRFPAQ